MVHMGHPEGCCICLESLSAKVVQLQCKHEYHDDCIRPIFKSSATSTTAIPIITLVERDDETVEVQEESGLTATGTCPICRSDIDESAIKTWNNYVNKKKRAREDTNEEETAIKSRRKTRNQKHMERCLKKESLQ